MSIPGIPIECLTIVDFINILIATSLNSYTAVSLLCKLNKGSSNNIYMVIKNVLDTIKHLGIKEYLKFIIFILLLLLCVFICLGPIKIFITYITGVNLSSLPVTIWYLVTLNPIMIYISNIILTKVSNILLGQNTTINYSIYSPNMLNAITPYRLLFLCITASIIWWINPLSGLLLYLGYSINLDKLIIEHSDILSIIRNIPINTLSVHPLTGCGNKNDVNIIDTAIKSIKSSLYHTFIGNNFVMPLDRYNSILHDNNIINHRNITQEICNAAYNKLSNKNRLMYLSSKQKYMAVRICNMAYKKLHEPFISTAVSIYNPNINSNLGFNGKSPLLLQDKINKWEFFNVKGQPLHDKPFSDKAHDISPIYNIFKKYDENLIDNIIKHTNKNLEIRIDHNSYNENFTIGPSLDLVFKPSLPSVAKGSLGLESFNLEYNNEFIRDKTWLDNNGYIYIDDERLYSYTGDQIIASELSVYVRISEDRYYPEQKVKTLATWALKKTGNYHMHTAIDTKYLVNSYLTKEYVVKTIVFISNTTTTEHYPKRLFSNLIIH